MLPKHDFAIRLYGYIFGAVYCADYHGKRNNSMINPIPATKEVAGFGPLVKPALRFTCHPTLQFRHRPGQRVNFVLGVEEVEGSADGLRVVHLAHHDAVVLP